MKKGLVISALFPPVGGIGVQRITKLIKYLVPKGCDITVLSVPEGSTRLKTDRSMFKDIPEGVKIIRPFFFDYRKIVPGEAARLFKPLERKFLFPDRFRIWNHFCLKRVKELNEKEKFDWVLVNCPPFSGVELASDIKTSCGLSVFINLRDPFCFNNYYILKSEKIKQQKAADIEREAFSKLDGIITVTPSHLSAYSTLYPDMKHKFSIVTNGFDPDDFEHFEKPEPAKDFFKISYSGSFSSLVPLSPILEAIYKLNTQNGTKIKFSISTNMSEKKVISLHKKCFEAGYAEFLGFLPHKKSIENLMKSHVLLLSFKNSPATEGSYPGKVFEYFKAQRPILLLNNTSSDLAKLIKDTRTGISVDIDDQSEIENAVTEFYRQWEDEGKIVYEPDNEIIENYSWNNLANSMNDILNCGGNK